VFSGIPLFTTAVLKSQPALLMELHLSPRTVKPAPGTPHCEKVLGLILTFTLTQNPTYRVVQEKPLRAYLRAFFFLPSFGRASSNCHRDSRTSSFL